MNEVIWDKENCYAYINVEKPSIPDALYDVAEQKGLKLKTEFHISIMVSDNSRRVREVIEKSLVSVELISDIGTLLRAFDWKFSTTNEYFLHENYFSSESLIINNSLDTTAHTRRSIVQKIVMPDIDSFYNDLKILIETKITTPVPHITLFTWSDYEPQFYTGIGINSAAQFKEFTLEKILA